MKRKTQCRCCGKMFVPEKPTYTVCAECWEQDDAPTITIKEQEGAKEE